jgi:hypothetical protein
MTFLKSNQGDKDYHTIRPGKILKIKNVAYVVESLAFDFFIDQSQTYNCRLNVCVDEIKQKKLPKDIITIPATLIKDAVISSNRHSPVMQRRVLNFVNLKGTTLPEESPAMGLDEKDYRKQHVEFDVNANANSNALAHSNWRYEIQNSKFMKPDHQFAIHNSFKIYTVVNLRPRRL